MATVVHDMRSPLMGVLANLELILEEANQRSDTGDIVSLASAGRTSGELLQMLVNDILDSARISRGKISADL